MFRKIAIFFESLVNPYPESISKYSEKNLFKFIWSCTNGLKKYIAIVTIFTSLVGIVESVIFSLIGNIVNKLSNISPSQLYDECGYLIISLCSMLLLSPLAVAGLTLFKFQVLQGNFPMKLRWNFHRLILSKDITFFQNEFSGNVATKVMQTALATKNIVIAFCDIFVFVMIYFISAAVVLTTFNIFLVLPFCIWAILYMLICIYFLPRLTEVAKTQAEDRSLTTGRISDAYANIATVKLFSYNKRESDYIRRTMGKYMISVLGQQRLVSAFDISVYLLSMIMVLSTAVISLWLWTKGTVGVGIIAASTAMALRFNSISQWAMWVIADFFEHIGTAKDGMNMLSYRNKLTDNAQADKFKVHSGEIIFKNVEFSYCNNKSVLHNFNLKIKPGEKIGLIGHSGAGKSTIISLLLRFYDLKNGAILIAVSYTHLTLPTTSRV